MNNVEIDRIEISLLLEAIYQRYGYDFRKYARASIERRIRQFLAKTDCRSISELIPGVLHDETFFCKMVCEFSITVTEMFRNPYLYRNIREKVVPLLKTYPFVKIWHAGCATGEEVYCMAILLTEEGLNDRTTIFATDFNDAALATAREGIYPLDHIKQYTRNYQLSGGTRSFSEYYHADYDSMAINRSLKKNITFANHNLATDSVFSEMHLILCRNVMIYFNKDLQNKVHRLFYESLVHNGFICIGAKESLRFSGVRDLFEVIDDKWRIYQKKR